MAATGGDTIVPTNWPGLLITALIVAAIAAATYFVVDMSAGSAAEVGGDDDKVTLQEMFSGAAAGGIEFGDTARAKPRAVSPDPYTGDLSSDRIEIDSADSDARSDAYSSETYSDDEQYEAYQSPSASDSSTAAYDSSSWDADPESESRPRKTSPAATRSPVVELDSKSAPARPAVPPPEALTAWWDEPGSSAALSLEYAGALAGGSDVSDAIALMFSDAVNVTQLGSHVRVTNEAGDPVPGEWQIARNPALVYLGGLKPGRYDVQVQAGISGRSGKTLASGVQGPVFLY